MKCSVTFHLLLARGASTRLRPTLVLENRGLVIPMDSPQGVSPIRRYEEEALNIVIYPPSCTRERLNVFSKQIRRAKTFALAENSSNITRYVFSPRIKKFRNDERSMFDKSPNLRRRQNKATTTFEQKKSKPGQSQLFQKSITWRNAPWT